MLDETGDFPTRCNREMVDLEQLTDPEEIHDLQALIQRHVGYTDSKLGQRILDNWDTLLPKFVKVMPRDYKRVLQHIHKALADGLTGDEALTAAFEENARDVARIGGS